MYLEKPTTGEQDALLPSLWLPFADDGPPASASVLQLQLPLRSPANLCFE